MNKVINLAAALVVTALLTLAFGAEAAVAENDEWFKSNFTLVRYMETESAAFNRQTISVYSSNASGNCYVVHGNGKRGGFSQVPCEDFVTDMVMLKEYERIEAKIADQTQRILENRRKLDEAIKKYQETFK